MYTLVPHSCTRHPHVLRRLMALIDALHEKSGCGGWKDRVDRETVGLLNIHD